MTSIFTPGAWAGTCGGDCCPSAAAARKNAKRKMGTVRAQFTSYSGVPNNEKPLLVVGKADPRGPGSTVTAAAMRVVTSGGTGISNSVEPFASVLKGDMGGLAASGEKGVLAVMAATHTGMTTEEFSKSVQEWVATAKHPKTGLLYTAMVYQPMLELLTYLRANGFKTFIVSGGGVEFMRPWTERVYGIPPEQVVGSAGKMKLEERDGKPVLIKLPEIELFDDKEGKPVGIQSRIGRRPIAAFGNSDGDLQMLQWTMAGPGARFALFVHHDDAAREFAYDRTDKLQQFNKGWDEAVAKGWTVVSMKNDWKTIYPSR